MSFAVRRFIEYTDRFDVLHRIELQEWNYGGGATEIRTSDSLSFEHEELSTGEDILKLYENPVQKGSYEIGLVVETQDDLTLIDDIANGTEDQFKIVWKQDGTVYWMGAVLNDLTDIPEMPLLSKFTVPIVAKDLSRLDGIDYDLVDNGRATIITVIAEILDKLQYGLSIETATSWISANTTNGTDFLSQHFIDRYTLQRYARTGDEEDEPITCLRALREICSAFCLTLRLEEGKWIIEQYTAYDDPTNVPITVYDSTGTVTSATTLTDMTGNANTIIKGASKSRRYPALKEARVTYNHRTSIAGAQIPSKIALTDVATSQTFTYVDQAIASQVYEIYSTPIQGDFGTISGLTEGDQFTGRIQMEIKAGQYWWDDVEQEWQNTQILFTKSFNVTYYETRDPVAPFSTGINLATLPTPPDTTGDFVLTVFGASWTFSGGGWADETTWNGLDVIFDNPNNEENSDYIDYKLTQPNEFSERYVHARTLFGDGPLKYSKGSITTSTSVDDLTNEVWGRRGGTADRAFHQNLLKEVLDVQRTSTKRTEAQTEKAYTPRLVKSYRGGWYKYAGGTWDGDTWSPILVQVAVNTNVNDVYKKLPKYAPEGVEGTTTTTPSGGGSVDQADGDNRWLNEEENLADLRDIAVARTNMGLGDLAIEDTINNTNWSGTDLAIVNGGTGASTAAGARTNLGLGSLAVQNTINNDDWNGTDLAVVNGGTGASTIVGAQQNLNLEPGVDIQSWDAQLDTLSGLTAAEATAIVAVSETQWGYVGNMDQDVHTGASPQFVNLQLTGTINYVNEENLQVVDKTITVNKTGDDATSIGAGLIIERGLSDDESMLWNPTDGFVFSDGIVIDDLVSGSAVFLDTLRLVNNGTAGENRYEVWDATNTKEIIGVGYLNGLTPNDPDRGGSFPTGTYGVWVDQAERMVIDGDVEYEGGDWIIEKNAEIIIGTDIGTASEIRAISIGTLPSGYNASYTGEKGLFIYGGTTSNTIIGKMTKESSILSGWTLSADKLSSPSGAYIDLLEGSDVRLRMGADAQFADLNPVSSFSYAAASAKTNSPVASGNSATHLYNITNYIDTEPSTGTIDLDKLTVISFDIEPNTGTNFLYPVTLEVRLVARVSAGSWDTIEVLYSVEDGVAIATPKALEAVHTFNGYDEIGIEVEITNNDDTGDSIQEEIQNLTVDQYKTETILRNDGIYTLVAPNRVVALGETSGGGSVVSGANYTAGTGLTLTSNEFSLDTTYTDGRYLQSESDPKGVSSASFSGTSTKTLTLTLNDTSTVTANFSDADTQRTDEEIRDVVGATLVGGTNVSIAVDDGNNTITISSTDTNTQRSNEEIQDVIGAMVVGSGATSVTYDDGANTLTISSTDTNTWRGIDDTPVNGQTSESISSNWAYDHANASNPHGITASTVGLGNVSNLTEFQYTQRLSNTPLDNTDDLDTITAEGFYSWISSLPANAPAAASYSGMIVLQDAGQPIQMVFGGSGSGELFIRRRDSGTWYGWTEFWSSANSDQFSTTGTYASVTVGNSTSLGGQGGSYYTNADNIDAGTVDYAYLPISSVEVGQWDTAYQLRATALSFSSQTLTLTRASVTNLTATIDAAGVGAVPSTGGTFSGTVTVTNGSDSSQQTYYGMQFDRVTSYLRPTTTHDASASLLVGDGTHRWSNITLTATSSFTYNGNNVWHAGNLSNVSTLTNDAGYYSSGSTPTFGDTLITGNLTVPNIIYHRSDTNTYMQFHAEDQWRVVTGGGERFEVTNTAINSAEPINAPNFVLTSDRRLKSDINDLGGGEFRLLNPKSFKKDGQYGFGFIADEVQRYFPQLVVERSDKYLGLKQDNIIALNTAGLIMVDDEVTKLKKRVEELEEQVRALGGAV